MLVNTEDAFLDFLYALRDEELVVLDTETTGLSIWPNEHNWQGARICGWVFGFADGRTYYIPVRHLSDEPQLDPGFVASRLRRALAARHRRFVGHNIKFDLHMAWADGIDLFALGDVHDTLLMAHLTDETRYSQALKTLGRVVLGDEAAADQQDWVKQEIKARGYDVNRFGYAQFAPSELAPYAEQDIHLTRRLYTAFRKLLLKENLFEVYHREQDVLPVVCAMERAGIAVDREYCENAVRAIDAKLPALKQELEGYATQANVYVGPRLLKSGKPAKNQSDPFQSGPTIAAIARGLGMHTASRTRSAREAQRVVSQAEGMAPDAIVAVGARRLSLEKAQELADRESWDKVTLSETDHPFCHALLQYRLLMKLRGTYFQPFLVRSVVESAIHCEFKQNGTRTGRFSSREPNLQNLPRPNPASADYEVKRAFVPRPGYVFLLADYASMEVAMLAQLTRDPALVEAIRRGDDPHKETARMVWPIFDTLPPGQKEAPAPGTQAYLRQQAKTLNFAVIYGAGGPKLGKMLSVSADEGKALRDRYFEGLPGVKKFRSSLYRQLEIVQPPDVETPYTGPRPTLRNLFGRLYHFNVRRLKEPRVNPWRGTTEYYFVEDSHAATNYDDQGSCADQVKEAMIRIHAALDGEDAQLLLQVHDEVVIECREADLQRLGRLVKAIMEDVPADFVVPMRVDLSVARTNWADKTPLEMAVAEAVA